MSGRKWLRRVNHFSIKKPNPLARIWQTGLYFCPIIKIGIKQQAYETHIYFSGQERKFIANGGLDLYGKSIPLAQKNV